MAKEKKEFKWFWQDPKEYALWEKLNSLTDEEFKREVPERLKNRLTYKYGNIYWFKPSENQKKPLQSNSVEIYVHGNNSSGKSFACGAAATAYEVMGWSPYKDIPPPKYGDKLIWVFSPTFDIQRSSSQIHLFSTDRAGDIGLLPSLGAIQEYGGKVGWAKNRCLDFVVFPDNTTLEFKTTEMQTFNLQASGIDFCWFDEEPRAQKRKDEITARLIRKNGRMMMTFILEDYNHWIITDIFAEYEKGNTPHIDFHFLDIEDNPTLTPEEVEMAKARVMGHGQEWRFSKGGKFVLVPTGDKVWSEAQEWHFTSGLLENYNPMKPIHTSWDLGYERPACIGFQLDKWNRRRYLFAFLGHKEYLGDFIDQIQGFINNYLPNVYGHHVILPHDSNRHYDVSRKNAKDIFKDKGFKEGEITVMYNKRETSFLTANEALQRTMDGEPVVLIDQVYAEPLKNALAFHTRDENFEPRKDRYHEHLSDCFKQAENWVKKGGRAVLVDPKEPSYGKISTAEGEIVTYG